MNKILFIFPIFIVPFFLFPKSVSAQRVSFPIPELGYCEDPISCYTYCEAPQNTVTCWSYGKFILKKNVLGESTESPDAKAKKTGVTFPVVALGNCTDTISCRDFCNDPVHYGACSQFAEIHGLVKTKNVSNPPSQILKAAKTELGCGSVIECKIFCQRVENAAKCAEFGEKYKLTKPRGITTAILVSAKAELGCTTEASCREFCSQSQNHDLCVEFGKKVGLISAEKAQMIQEERQIKEELMRIAKEELGCLTALECSEYCQKEENKNACRETYQKVKIEKESREKQENTKRIETSGCTTEEECRAYCEINPKKCPGFAKRSNQVNQSGSGDFTKLSERPKTIPSRNPEEIQTTNTTQQYPLEMEKENILNTTTNE